MREFPPLIKQIFPHTFYNKSFFVNIKQLIDGMYVEKDKLNKTIFWIPRKFADDELFVEHPSGAMGVRIKVEINGENIVLRESGFLRTARKIFEGSVFLK